MNFHRLTTAAYIKLHELMESHMTPLLVPFLSFEYEPESKDFIYTLQEQDFTRELVNSFNQFAYWLARIDLWERVLLDYDDDDKEELRFEFTKIPLDYCLHFPYQFKSRLAFCATQLCYIRGLALNLISHAEVHADEKINLASLESVSRHWDSASHLLSVLRQIDSLAYRNSTLNYRNKAQHRHGPRTDSGHVANITRSFPEGMRFAYTFGEIPPLMATVALPVLAAEATNLQAGFSAYRGLIAAHWSVPSEP
jgi:hypothetical protein